MLTTMAWSQIGGRIEQPANEVTPGSTRIRLPGLKGFSPRLRTVLVVVAVVPVIVVWIHGLWSGANGGSAARDFAVFYTAGDRVLDGGFSELYELEAFRGHYGSIIGESGPFPNVLFGNSPPFAALMAPLTFFGVGTAFIIWTIIGIGAAAAAFRIIGFGWRTTSLAVAAVLLTPPGVSLVGAGQSSFYWLLIFAGVFALLRRGVLVGAGALAGLLILKPPLLIGFGVWWLLDRSKRTALVGLVGSTTAIVAVTWPWMGEAWLSYPGAILSFADAHRTAVGQLVQLSPWSFFALAIPGTSLAALLAGSVLAIGGGILITLQILRHADDLAFAFAASVALVLWVSPQVLIHDWVLLAIALAVLHNAYPAQAQMWRDWGLLLAAAASAGLLLSVSAYLSFGFTVQIGVLALALAMVSIAHFRNHLEPPLEIVIDLRNAEASTPKHSQSSQEVSRT